MIMFVRKMLGFVTKVTSLSAYELMALSAPRSSKWRKVRKEHLEANPSCAACGGFENVVPHHIIPVHLEPSMELDPLNLISLCEGKVCNCHLFFGHLRNWCRYNPEIIEDAKKWKDKISSETTRTI
jgi:hypothetical protein